MQSNQAKISPIQLQKILVAVAIILFGIKIFAWYLTSSLSILTDALESIVNIVASIIGLYSIIISAKPQDKDHPNGHGKIEFIAAAIEGILVVLAGILIIHKSIQNLISPKELSKLDFGLVLIAITAIINYLIGMYCIQKGEKENSPILVSSGTHLKSDTYSTVGLLLGILLILITGYKWIDSVAALIFAFLIIYTGYKIIRKAISGIMDEADEKIIAEIITIINKNRIDTWIDIHNMRVINYAGFFHIDCHLTVPFYINVNEAHEILDELTNLLKIHFKNKVEFFVHIDGCLPKQCSICKVQNCTQRKQNFVQIIDWNTTNILLNQKHSL